MTCQDALNEAMARLADGSALQQAGRLDEALASYQAATLLADSESVLREMAALANQTGRLQLALRLYRRLLRRMPEDSAQLCYTIGSLYRQLGRLDRSQWWFERVLAAPEASPTCRGGSHFHLGGIHLRNRDARAAADHFRQALRILPNHAKAQELLNAM
jgi:tetratricopeptide (TPR) repeat protein